MDSKEFLKIATGRSKYSIYFLLIFMCVAPAAVFTELVWLDVIAWTMLIILGVFIFITGVVTRKEAAESPNWPQVEARLISASLKWTSSNSGGRSYAPDIKCEFFIDGVKYTGTEYDFSASYGQKKAAEDKIASVKSQPLRVYYKPCSPEVNVIHPGVRSTHYLRIIIGLFAVIIPVLINLGVIRLS